MKYLFKFLTVPFYLGFCVGCSDPASSSQTQNYSINKLVTMDTNYKTVGYDTTILIIEKKAMNNVSWDGLFDIKEFINLYENSGFYIDSAIDLLGRKEFTNVQKKISINTMQMARLDDYLKLCKKCKILYDNGEISEDILSWVISPNFSNRYLIVKNYRNSNVIALLKSIKDESKVSNEFTKSIENILSGKTWEQIKEMSGETN
jgi:hypothetical protein